MVDDVPEIDPALGLERATDALYGLRPEEFIPARDAAAKGARAAGDRDLAAALAALRKPTASAWLANLLVRDDPDLADRLTELGEGLRAAEASLDGQALRDLGVQRRQLVGSLVQRARALGAAQGHRVGDPVVQELDRTLTAALADSDAAEEILSGRLTGPREHVGFGAARPNLRVVRDPSPTAPSTPKQAAPTRPRAAAPKPSRDEAVTRARAAAQDAERDLEAARRSLATKQAEHDRAEREVGRAEAEHAARRDDRAQAHTDSEHRRRELAAAQAAADRAEARLREAEAAEESAVAAVTAGREARSDAVRDVRAARAAVTEAERAATAARKAVTAVEKGPRAR